MFDYFWIGDLCVGHVRVNPGHAVVIPAGTGTSRNRLVVAVIRIAEQDIVHRALTARREIQGLDERINQALTGFDIAAHHRRRSCRIGLKRRVQQAIGWDRQLDRLEHPFVERHWLINEQTKDIHHGADHNCRSRVEVSPVRR